MSLAASLKDYALDLGYAAVGIAAADPFDAFADDLVSRGEPYAFYRQSPRRPLEGARPRDVWPQARSIIVVAYDYATRAFPQSLIGVIGRVYQARAYGPPPNRINGARRELFAAFLRENGLTLHDGITVPLRQAAAQAGVATFGNNNFAYARGAGSFICLDAFVTDAELPPDAPTLRVPCPKGCTACRDACPTGALLGPLRLEPRRCITFNNCFARDGWVPGVSGFIPHDIRRAMGSRIHGCDACQEACPRNKARLSLKLPPDPFLEGYAAAFRLADVLRMDEAYFHGPVQQLMYNYIREKKFLQRNAAIALGNAGDPEAVPPLVAALADPEPLVRGHAAWALGRLATPPARRALETARTREAHEVVSREIESALAGEAA